jgi:hypothetical protein
VEVHVARLRTLLRELELPPFVIRKDGDTYLGVPSGWTLDLTAFDP